MKQTTASSHIFQDYYRLTKPGIIYGNLLTAIGGFILGAKGQIHVGLAVAAFLGISLIIASACVVNNYIDRGIDSRMERTKKRAMVTRTISVRNAMIYAAILGVIGFGVLLIYTNTLTFVLGLTAYFVYVVWYGIEKRRSTLGTLVGSIAGSMPPVAGYTAVTGNFDAGAFILFLILTLWQMPHFYAIAIYRLKDYQAAGIPVLPAVKGMKETKIHILLYITGFLISLVLLTIFGYAGYLYLVIMLGLGVWWLIKGAQGFQATDDNAWARKLFFQSLILITSLSVILPVDTIVRHGISIGW